MFDDIRTGPANLCSKERISLCLIPSLTHNEFIDLGKGAILSDLPVGQGTETGYTTDESVTTKL